MEVGAAVRTYPLHPAERLVLDPFLAELREHEPVSRIRLPFGGEAWLVTRYEDARVVLSDARFGRAAATGPDVARMTPEPGGAAAGLRGRGGPVEERADGPRAGIAAGDVVAPAATRSIWRHEDFRQVWFAHAASQVGFRIGGIAIPLLAVSLLSVSAFDMGLLNAAQTVGTVLVGPLDSGNGPIVRGAVERRDRHAVRREHLRLGLGPSPSPFSSDDRLSNGKLEGPICSS